MDAFDPGEPYSRVYFLNENSPNLWTFNEHDFVIPSLCVWQDPSALGQRIFVALSEDGRVVLLGPKQTEENIADAGLPRPNKKGYGYLNCIQQIGNRLYACGYSGQVYRRNNDSTWEHMDHGLLQEPGVSGGEYFVQVINGPHENAIYVAGSENRANHPPRVDFWDGSKWTRVTLPATAGRITNMYIESEERIWLCGSKGTLLMGNARDGFSTMNPLGSTQLILSVTKYRDVIYLGTNVGLLRFDPFARHPFFHRVRTQLDPELVDTNIVQCVDDVLWSMGPKDIARLDGQGWKRFHHPDNAPIQRLP